MLVVFWYYGGMKTTSRLASMLPVILDARKKRKSWRAICTLLETDFGIQIGVGNLYRWFQRERKRARQLQAELGDFAQYPKTSSSPERPDWAKKINAPAIMPDDLDLGYKDPTEQFTK